MITAQNRQQYGRLSELSISLPVLAANVPSPYFRMSGHGRTGRLKELNARKMTKAMFQGTGQNDFGNDTFAVYYYTADAHGFGTSQTANLNGAGNKPSTFVDTADYRAKVGAAIIADAAAHGITVTSNEIIWNIASDISKADIAKVFTTPTRALDTAFQPSTARDTLGIYSVQIASNLSLSGGQLGSLQLKIADDSGLTTNVVTLTEIANGNTGTLTIGLNTVQTTGGVLMAMIPAGKYVKLVSVDTTGTPTQSIVRSQEVQM